MQTKNTTNHPIRFSTFHGTINYLKHVGTIKSRRKSERNSFHITVAQTNFKIHSVRLTLNRTTRTAASKSQGHTFSSRHFILSHKPPNRATQEIRYSKVTRVQYLTREFRTISFLLSHVISLITLNDVITRITLGLECNYVPCARGNLRSEQVETEQRPGKHRIIVFVVVNKLWARY